MPGAAAHTRAPATRTTIMGDWIAATRWRRPLALVVLLGLQSRPCGGFGPPAPEPSGGEVFCDTKSVYALIVRSEFFTLNDCYDVAVRWEKGPRTLPSLVYSTWTHSLGAASPLPRQHVPAPCPRPGGRAHVMRGGIYAPAQPRTRTAQPPCTLHAHTCTRTHSTRSPRACSRLADLQRTLPAGRMGGL